MYRFLKTLHPGGIRAPGIFCSVGGRDDHYLCPLPGQAGHNLVRSTIHYHFNKLQVLYNVFRQCQSFRWKQPPNTAKVNNGFLKHMDCLIQPNKLFTFLTFFKIQHALGTCWRVGATHSNLNGLGDAPDTEQNATSDCLVSSLWWHSASIDGNQGDQKG
jgi:hypothetical protein